MNWYLSKHSTNQVNYLSQRQARKAYLLRQGQLLTAAYEAGQLRAMLEQLKAEPHSQTQQQLEPQL